MRITTTPADAAGRFSFPGTALEVARMGYGAMQLAGPHVFGPPKDEEAAKDVLRTALALGVDHIDTSDFYGPYVTNRLIREALHPYPDDLVLVTKVGARRGDDGSWLPAFSPDELEAAVMDNLQRLALEAVDIVNLRMIFGMGPTEGSIAAQITRLAELQQRGLVKHIGVSNATPAQIAEARATCDVVCVQNHYNLVHREDDELIDALAADGIAYVPYFPLGGFSPIQSRGLTEAARALEVSPQQLALAWLLQRSPNILLIPGTASAAHLRENVAAASLEIPEDVLARLNALHRQ
ncbi:MAG: oxidoreductase [Myxococcales bacterium]|nr:oxidoreductase [Myxococcales bacterium]MCB9755901.1 oxidoreductase [Myxococcales bacterium]